MATWPYKTAVELEFTSSAISCAAGWLCGKADRAMGYPMFRPRVVAALTDDKLTFEFLVELEKDIQREYERAGLANRPSLRDFLRLDDPMLL